MRWLTVLALVGLAATTAAWLRQRAGRRAVALRLATRQEQFSVLAHELKTPLALISATSEILLSPVPGDLNDDQRRFVHEIDESAARILLLADNILTESKLEAGVFAPSFSATDVRPLLREVWRSMHRLADSRGQRLALDYPQQLDRINIDAALVRQAVVNLVQNAIRHTSAGGVVNIRAYQNESDIVISVWDDGAGLDPAHRKAVLRRFVSYSGGTGLGLTIVETIARLHHGKLLVDTSLGDGAAFLLALPRGGGRGVSSAPTLLVVDDEAQLVNLIAYAARGAGYDVHTASTGAEAMGTLARHHVDLAVLDVVLPDIDGHELCRRIRLERDLPVVFLTVRADQHDVIAGLQAGGDDYLAKPFSVEELFLRIGAILRRTAEPQRLDGPGGLELRPDTHEALLDAEPLELTPLEFRFVRYLALNEHRVVGVPELVRQVWELAPVGSHDAIVKSVVYRIRHKFDAVGPGRLELRNVRGVGYQLRDAGA